MGYDDGSILSRLRDAYIGYITTLIHLNILFGELNINTRPSQDEVETNFENKVKSQSIYKHTNYTGQSETESEWFSEARENAAALTAVKCCQSERSPSYSDYPRHP